MDRDNAPATATQSNSGGDFGRRAFMKGIGATAAGAASIRYAPDEYSPVGEAEAIPPLVLAGAAIAGSAAVGWAIREWEVLGKDDPPTGLTASALSDEVMSTTKARKSNNQSTFVDNRNILSTGFSDSLYAEGKVAAIEALNQSLTQAEVESAALDAMNAQMATIEANLLKSWNESVNEYESLHTAVSDHTNLTATNMFPTNLGSATYYFTESATVTLADGTSFTEQQIHMDDGTNYTTYGTVNTDISDTSYDFYHVTVEDPNSTTTRDYLQRSDWNGVWSEMQTVRNNVSDGLLLWVDKVYAKVADGELDTAELLTPTELSQLSADGTQYSRAVADLMALNIAVDLEKQAKIHLPDIGANLTGSLGVSGETTLSAPSTVDPTTDTLSYYFTYDTSTGSGKWQAYQTTVDGGDVTFTKEPFTGVDFTIQTAAGETAVLTSADFTDNGDGTFTASISDQVDTAITEVNSVSYEATSDKTNYESMQLTSPFDIISFLNADGTESSSSSYTQSTVHDDSNYITQKEWDAREKRYKELIDKYEESTSGGGGVGGGGGFLGDGLFSDTKTLGVVAGGAALAALLFGNN